MLADTRMSALLAKVGTQDPTAVPAATALRMATLNGAKALGIAERTGSLAVGKDADVIALDLGSLETAPAFDPISHIVYAAGREQVSHVWVAGRALLRERTLLTVNEAELLGKAEAWRVKIAG